MKIEKTCRCIESTPALPKQGDMQLTCSFIAGREYQTDIYVTAVETFYKVYQNGGWDDWTMLPQDEFSKWFREI